MNYDYKIVISPWYPSYAVMRRPANTDGEWEHVSNGSSTRGVVKKMVIRELDAMFEQPKEGK